jgi:drug/metabolite transporter (DMT)-like permease
MLLSAYGLDRMMLSAGMAALLWGASDFSAGVLSRRLRVSTVLIWSKGFAMVLAVPFVLVGGLPSGNDLRLAVAAGLVGLPAMGLLYRAMRDGSLTVVAPVAAAAALVPVGWGIFGGERFGLLGAVGVAVALIGITLASWPVRSERRQTALPMLSALGAAAGFGAFFVLLHEASRTEPYQVIAVARVTEGIGALILAAVFYLRRGGSWQTAGSVVGMCGIGVLDAAGDAAFVFAVRGGPLGPAALLASMYPAVTVLLNRSLLRERMHTIHLCGVLAALFAVACLTG